jgi:hypothetical protein
MAHSHDTGSIRRFGALGWLQCGLAEPFLLVG